MSLSGNDDVDDPLTDDELRLMARLDSIIVDIMIDDWSDFGEGYLSARNSVRQFLLKESGAACHCSEDEDPYPEFVDNGTWVCGKCRSVIAGKLPSHKDNREL